MSFIKNSLLLMLAILPLKALAQDRFNFLWEPQAAINYSVSPTYSHNFSLAVRNYLYRDGGLELKARQVDIAHFSTLQVQTNQSLAIGLQYRFGDTFGVGAQNELRLTQQYNHTHSGLAARLGHRLRAEQRFRNSGTVHRFRYRLALDSPLDGEKLNVGEAYIVSSIEGLFAVGKQRLPEYDSRLEIGLGWMVNRDVKVETGLEYRLEDLSRQPIHLLFLTSNLVISL